jgi:hypothetical protein
MRAEDPMLGWTLWLATSYAADGMLAGQVRERVTAVHETTGGTIVVAADTEADLAAMRLALGSPMWIRYTLGAPSGFEGAATAGQAACGVHVQRAGAGSFWALTETAGCSAPLVVAPPPLAAVPQAPSTAMTPSPPTVAAQPLPVVGPPPLPMAVPPPPTQWSSQKMLDLELAAPSPGTALLLSTLVGFGSGHYYAGDSASGGRHLGVQAAGFVVASVASIAASQSDNASGLGFIELVGLTTLSVDRIIEVVNAPFKAHQTAARMVSTGSARRYTSSDTW